MCMDYTFCKGSMEACATQQEIFDEIEESDDEPPVDVSPVGTKISEDTPGKKPTRRRKLVENNEFEVMPKKSQK